MISVSSLAACDNPMIPDRHQCLLRLTMMNLMGISGIAELQDPNYCSAYNAETEGYLVYIQPRDDQHPLTELSFTCLLSELDFDGVLFCEYSQCFSAVLVTNNSFAYQFIVPVEHISASTQAYLLKHVEITSLGSGLNSEGSSV